MAPPPPTGYGAPPPPPQNNGIANQMGQMSLNGGMQPPPPMQQPPAPQMYSAPPAPPPPSQPTRAPAAPQFYQAPASMQSPQGVGGGGQFMSPGAPHSFQQQQHSQAPYTGQPNPNPYANQQQAQQPYGGQRQAPAPTPAANVDYMAQVDLSIEVPKQVRGFVATRDSVTSGMRRRRRAVLIMLRHVSTGRSWRRYLLLSLRILEVRSSARCARLRPRPR
jgi:hypothetical protein